MHVYSLNSAMHVHSLKKISISPKGLLKISYSYGNWWIVQCMYIIYLQSLYMLYYIYIYIYIKIKSLW